MLATAYNRFDVIFLSALSSVQQLGLYAPASRIQDLLYLLPGSLYAIALPMLSAASRKPNQSGEVYLLIRRFVGFGLLISIPTALAVFLFAGEMLRFVLGPAYMGSVTSTRILIWFLPMAAAGAPLIAALAACGHGADTTKIFATAFAVALSLHLLLDPRWGAVGGAVASLLRDPLALLVAFLLARRAGLLRKPEPAVPAQGLLSSEIFQ